MTYPCLEFFVNQPGKDLLVRAFFKPWVYMKVQREYDGYIYKGFFSYDFIISVCSSADCSRLLYVFNVMVFYYSRWIYCSALFVRGNYRLRKVETFIGFRFTRPGTEFGLDFSFVLIFGIDVESQILMLSLPSWPGKPLQTL